MGVPYLIVEAFAGYKGEKTPRSFTLEGTTLRVERIMDRWYTDTHSYFRVRASDGERYVLRLDLDEDCWELVMLERGQGR
jgi:hypothetical protein